MGRKRPKPEEIVSKLRQVEVLQGQGMSIADAVRQIGGEGRRAPLVRAQPRTSKPTTGGASSTGLWAGHSSSG